MAITKGELIELLDNDDMPLSTEMGTMLKATNNDTTVVGTFEGLYYSRHGKKLMLTGVYEEEF